ncbi:MAG: NADH-quinone oxidoreductase subunit N [Myxococcota bacterium]
MISVPDIGRSLWLSSPALLVFTVAMVVMLAEAIARPARKTFFWAASLAALIGAGALTFFVAGNPEDAWLGMLRVDGYGHFFQICALAAGVLSLLISEDYLERLGVRVGEYYALVLFGVLGMMLMGYSNDLMMVFISLEVMSISMYVLCALKRSDPRSVESGFKYFILGAFSSGLMLYGISLLYGATGSTALPALARWLGEPRDAAEGALVLVGGALLVVGFGFKVASVPFHMWAPDVYQGAPTSVTALMAGGVKAASFAAFGRFVLGALGEHAVDWQGALWWMAALTMLVGNIGALVQEDLKRMLAYSSIAHAGYLLMALVAGAGIGGASLLFYVLAYTFMNAGAFAVLSLLTRDGEDLTSFDRIAGLGKSHPWLAAGLSVCLLSLAGIPPTMGFVGKFYLFAAVLEAGHVDLAVVGAVSAAIGVYYYLRPMLYMYMRDGHPDVAEDRVARFTAVLCAALMVALGAMPGPVLEWAKASVASL